MQYSQWVEVLFEEGVCILGEVNISYIFCFIFRDLLTFSNYFKGLNFDEKMKLILFLGVKNSTTHLTLKCSREVIAQIDFWLVFHVIQSIVVPTYIDYPIWSLLWKSHGSGIWRLPYSHVNLIIMYLCILMFRDTKVYVEFVILKFKSNLNKWRKFLAPFCLFIVRQKLLIWWKMKKKAKLSCYLMPERIYNSHYGNGVLAMFIS